MDTAWLCDDDIVGRHIIHTEKIGIIRRKQLGRTQNMILT